MSIRDSILNKIATEEANKLAEERRLTAERLAEQKKTQGLLGTIRYDQLEHVFITLTTWLRERLEHSSVLDYYVTPSLLTKTRKVYRRCVIVNFHVDILSEKTIYNPFYNYSLGPCTGCCIDVIQTKCTFCPNTNIEIRRGRISRGGSIDYGAYYKKPIPPDYAHLSHEFPPFEDTDSFGVLHIRDIEHKELNKRFASWLIENDIYIADSKSEFMYTPRRVDLATFEITHSNFLILFL